jgi:Cu/Ag efflux pump CusA
LNGVAPSTWWWAWHAQPFDLEQIISQNRRGWCSRAFTDVARIELGPEIRRGISDLDGKGDAWAVSS